MGTVGRGSELGIGPEPGRRHRGGKFWRRRPGLVVFQVQPVEPGPNIGRFRIGRKLAADGTVTGGWSDWQTVPNWISWRDQGAAIAVADLDGNGQPDLVVFHI